MNANNKYMKNYNKNIMKASMYLKYCDVNDSYG